MPTKTAVVLALVSALAAAGVAAAATRGTTVALHKTSSLGKVLSTSTGMTLYMYKPDSKGKSVCNAGCDTTWPPLTTKGKPHAGKGIRQSLLGTTRRSDGKLQVTYKGHPLYAYVGDSKAGQANGEGYGGIWFALSAAGKKATAPAAGTAGDGGYGGGGSVY